jgi:ubiquinone/menaquinone biosynthesis C-methylase UbiE
MDSNAAEFVGSIPDFYDRGLGPVLFADYAAMMAERVAAFAPRNVLETATGTGIVTRALRDRLPATTVITATDLNPPMLAIANAKFTASEVSFAIADAQALAFADGRFDAVVCQFGIMFYPDKAKATREAFRVLAPGGRYFFSVWDAHRYNSFARVTDTLIKRHFPDNPPSFYAVPFSSAAIDPIKGDLLDAGFINPSIDVVRIDKTIVDLELFVRGLIFGNPLVDQIRARGTVSPEQLYSATVEALADELGRSPSVAPLQTIFYSAIKPR